MIYHILRIISRCYNRGSNSAPFSPFALLWLRVRSFCGIMKYNTVFRYGCALHRFGCVPWACLRYPILKTL